MSDLIKKPQSCTQAVLQEGKIVLESDDFTIIPGSLMDNGGILLRGKMTDSFCFVDHPRLELDPFCTEIVSFGCDCPEYKQDRKFCPHCAALVVALESELQVNATASEAEDTFDEEDFSEEEFDEDFDDDDEEDEDDDEFDKELFDELIDEVFEKLFGDKMTELKDFTYKFCNCAEHLYPHNPAPRIPLQRYIQVFGNNARARMIYNMAGPWGGSCFGMIATATMLYQDDTNAHLKDFRAEAQFPAELRLTDRSNPMGMTLHQFIEAVHITQYANSVSYPRNASLQDPQIMEKLVKRVKDFQRGEALPVGMAIFANPQYQGGHAILPYRLEHVDGNTDVLHIYDPNAPETVKYATLEKDDNGKYMNWRFPMTAYETYSGATGGQLGMDEYEYYKGAWDNHGSLNVENMLSVAAGVAVLDANGSVLARVTSEGVELKRDDIRRILVTDGGPSGAVMLSLPAGAYRFRQEDPQQETLSVQMCGVELSASLVTSAREAMLWVNDAEAVAMVQIGQPNCQYSLEILETVNGQVRAISMVGVTTDESLCVMHKDGNLCGQGIAESTALYIDEEMVSLDCINAMPEVPQQERQEECEHQCDENCEEECQHQCDEECEEMHVINRKAETGAEETES